MFRQPIVPSASPSRAVAWAKAGWEWNIGWEANAALLNTASPNTFRDWGTYSLAKPTAQSAAATDFKFSVASLLSLVPGRTCSTNQLQLGRTSA